MFTQPIAFVVFLSANPAPSPPPVSKEIQEAANNLDHDEYKTRASAARKLLNAGKEAIEPLVRVARTGSVDAADRAVKILAEIASNPNPESMSAGREALRAIAASNSSAAAQAQSAVDRYRGQLVDRMQEAGAQLPVQRRFDSGDLPRCGKGSLHGAAVAARVHGD